MDEQTNPFESSLVRTLVGLSGASLVVVIAILFFEGPIRWFMLGIAALDVVVTPYILKKATVEQEPQNDPTA